MNTRLTRARTRNTKKQIFAIPTAAPAMPPNPRKPATRAMMKRTTVQYSISISLIDSAPQAGFEPAYHRYRAYVLYH